MVGLHKRWLAADGASLLPTVVVLYFLARAFRCAYEIHSIWNESFFKFIIKQFLHVILVFFGKKKLLKQCAP